MGGDRTPAKPLLILNPAQQSEERFPQCPDAVIKTFCEEQAPQREWERSHGTSQGTS